MEINIERQPQHKRRIELATFLLSERALDFSTIVPSIFQSLEIYYHCHLLIFYADINFSPNGKGFLLSKLHLFHMTRTHSLQILYGSNVMALFLIRIDFRFRFSP